MKTLANYRLEREAFNALLQEEQSHRILMFRGESGTGKTSLLTSCKRQKGMMNRDIQRIPVDLRSGAVNVAELFSRLLGSDATTDNFPHVMQSLQGMQDTTNPPIHLHHNQQEGSGNLLQVVLQNISPSEREERQVRLTDAWFRDVRRDQSILRLIFLDTYEKANTEVKDWISGPFLARVANDREHIPVRVVIAGQEIPDVGNIEWGEACQQYDLHGVREVEHWLPVARSMRRIAPPGINSLHDHLATICQVFHGRPSEIMQWIETLPREH